MRGALLALATVVSLPSLAGALLPAAPPAVVGEGFRVREPAAGITREGWTTVWEDTRDGILMRRLDASGTPIGEPVTLAANTEIPVPFAGEAVFHQAPALITYPAGDFVLAWVEERAEVRYDILFADVRPVGRVLVARHFDAAGRATSELFRLSTEGTWAGRPRAARGADGRALVVWGELAGTVEVVRARPVERSGAPAGPAAEIATAAIQPDVAAGTDGSFLVAWSTCCGPGGQTVAARLFDGDGSPLAAPVDLPPLSGGKQTRPTVAGTADGGYLLAWSATTVARGVRLRGIALDAEGAARSGEVALGAGIRRHESHPRLAAGPGGRLVLGWVVWIGDFPVSVVVQELAADGSRVGPPSRVNVQPIDFQVGIAVAPRGDRTLMAWADVIDARTRALLARVVSSR